MPAVAASTIKNGRSPENDHEAFCSACTTTDGVPPAAAGGSAVACASSAGACAGEIARN